MVLKERSDIDDKLRELIGEHMGGDLGAPARDDIVAPAGMSVEEEAELVTLLSLADANLDGDEQAAIERLVASLDGIRNR